MRTRVSGPEQVEGRTVLEEFELGDKPVDAGRGTIMVPNDVDRASGRVIDLMVVGCPLLDRDPQPGPVCLLDIAAEEPDALEDGGDIVATAGVNFDVLNGDLGVMHGSHGYFQTKTAVNRMIWRDSGQDWSIFAIVETH